MAGRRRRLLGLVGTGVRLLPKDRLDSQWLDSPRLPFSPRFLLDLLDQFRDPLTVLLRSQIRPAGKLRQLQIVVRIS